MSNKELVSGFTKVILNGREYDRVEEYLHKDFISHKIGQPSAVGLQDAFHNSIKQFLSAVPTASFEVKKIIAEGDYVWTYAEVSGLPGGTGMVSVDILRIADGRIIEKWDVQQPLSN